MNNRQPWDFGRFLQTIAFFDGLPFLNCLKRMILKTDSPSHSNPTATGTLLLVGTTPPLRQQLLPPLQAAQYPLRVVLSPNEDLPSPQPGVEYYPNTPNPQASELPPLLNHVQSVIYTGDINALPPWIDVIAQYLGTGNETLLFDFRQPNDDLKASWGAVDDVVMGGVSASGIRCLVGEASRSEGRAIFAGNVSTANSGGFASVRNRNFDPPLDLSHYDGIQLRVKGDGQRYKLILRSEGRWDGVSYCYSFDTVAGEWITVSVPFRDLRPVFRAKTLTNVGEFDTSRTYSFQLMLSKFEYDGALNPHFTAGGFSLEIATIQAYGGVVTPKLIIFTNNELPPTIASALNQSNLAYKTLEMGDTGEALAAQILKVLSPV
ncbi:CIA30 family protein [Spirulina subsalsa]|uniref:CIA30 family protein n=1 Tax=Spirulina subsalsa TaxID=54311 RepID=UPI0002E740F0|nr:CIA30 family protein [Spirulina subsalsa]